jgi:hypothetical protein
MLKIIEKQLESDLAYRFQYLAEFMGFGADDTAAIHEAAPIIAPLVPTGGFRICWDIDGNG